MGKSIPAMVTPQILQWARNLDMITVEEIAYKLKVPCEKIEAWESGTECPTMNQAKVLSKQYRVPFAYFYLPDMPRKIKRLDKVDYRTFGNIGTANMSRELRWFLRDIEERRDVMLELYADIEEKLPAFTNSVSKNSSIEDVASTIRNLLALSQSVQIKFRKPENALSYCISKLEEKGFLIFQAAKIPPVEMRGLSIAYEVFPIIALNRKDEKSARLFTLLHELVHILTRTSGICNDTTLQGQSNYDIEMFCNKVAGCALVPENELKSNPSISLIQKYGVDDTYINAIARDFAVSKEVIINRLWAIGVITKSVYFDTLHRYTEEYLAYKRNKKGGFLLPALDKGTQVGKLYARTVMMAYHTERISPRDASNYLLGLRMQHFGTIERWCY